MNIHEQEIIRFIRKNKQERVSYMLSVPHKRGKFLNELGHYGSFDDLHTFPIKEKNPQLIYTQLLELGAPDTCYAISEIDAIDGVVLNLFFALKKIVGSDFGTILSCIPGKLAYYEGENERLILKKYKEI